MRGSESKVLRVTPEMEQTLMKTSFLSYYISMYNTVNEQAGYDNTPVTVDEIYDFLQDLRHETEEAVPNIDKQDIIFSFNILGILGICKTARSQ